MRVNIIAAIGKKRELGKNNKLLWNIPDDMKRFRELTSGHPVIMGRKTFESIISYGGKPLPNRTNIVITRELSFKRRGLSKLDFIVAQSIEEALRLASSAAGNNEIFVIGGGQIYKEALDKGLVDKLYLTIIEREFSADTFFPDYSEFKRVVHKEEHESGGYKFTFLELERG